MISIVLILIACYLAAGTLLALALGRFMRHTSEREEAALVLQASEPVRRPERKTA